MRTIYLPIVAAVLCLFCACSPQDFLTRRLAADLISVSEAFKAPQMFWMATGVESNKDFNSPDSMVLQRRGWILGIPVPKCPVGVEPAPCWDVVLSPLGVDTIRPLIAGGSATGPIAIQAARRELVAITGISKAGKFADVEFTWHWVPLNQVGAALYDSGVHYRSTVAFRAYDDGWRVVTAGPHSNQTIEEALRNAEATAQ